MFDMQWLVYAFVSAGASALTAILAKVALVANTNSPVSMPSNRTRSIPTAMLALSVRLRVSRDARRGRV